MNNKVSTIINSVTSTSSKSIEKIIDLVQYVNIEKGEFIAEIGEKNNLEYFVIQGICKIFLHNTEGAEVTLSFSSSDSFISPFSTRCKEGKSILNIRALTDMEVATIDTEKFKQLMREDPEIKHFGNVILRNELMEKVQKEIERASFNSKARLQLLRDRYPNIENLIPNCAIASYLGITTISLGRLKAQL